MKTIITILCIIGIGTHNVASQCLNRQPNLVFNRQIPETIVEAPLIYPQPQSVYQPTLRDVQPILNAQIRDIPPLLTSPTTIITDCTPSVCKTLIDIIQFMSVCNLIKEKQGGSDVALQLAEPFFKELMSSQSLSNPVLTKAIAPCLNPAVRNTFSPNLISPGIQFSNSVVRNPISPNLINPSVISTCSNQIVSNPIPQSLVNPGAISSIYPDIVGFPSGVSNVNSNVLVGNILSMLGN